MVIMLSNGQQENIFQTIVVFTSRKKRHQNSFEKNVHEYCEYIQNLIIV